MFIAATVTLGAQGGYAAFSITRDTYFVSNFQGITVVSNGHHPAAPNCQVDFVAGTLEGPADCLAGDTVGSVTSTTAPGAPAPPTAVVPSVGPTPPPVTPTAPGGSALPTDRSDALERVASRSFFAEGYTGPGYQEYLSLLNPGLQVVRVRVTIYYASGQRQITSALRLVPLSRRTLDINALAPRDSTALQVEADGPLVAERALYHGNGHVVAGAPRPSTRWYLSEGYAGQGFTDSIRIFNPGKMPVTVTIAAHQNDGSSRSLQRVVLGQARLNVAIDDIALRGGVALTIQSSAPVVVEEVVQKAGASGPSAATGLMQVSQTWYFPDGATSRGNDEYIVAFNPNPTPVRMHLQFVTSDGYTRPFNVRVGPRARGVIDVGTHLARPGLAVIVQADHPMVVQATRYTSTGGLSVINPAPQPARTWAFADGYAGQGLKEWLSFLNPGTQRAMITVRLIGRRGVMRVMTLSQPPHQRRYLYVNDLVQKGPVAAVITATHPIVAGRTVIGHGGTVLSTTVGVVLPRLDGLGHGTGRTSGSGAS